MSPEPGGLKRNSIPGGGRQTPQKWWGEADPRIRPKGGSHGHHSPFPVPRGLRASPEPRVREPDRANGRDLRGGFPIDCGRERLGHGAVRVEHDVAVGRAERLSLSDERGRAVRHDSPAAGGEPSVDRARRLRHERDEERSRFVQPARRVGFHAACFGPHGRRGDSGLQPLRGESGPATVDNYLYTYLVSIQNASLDGTTSIGAMRVFYKLQVSPAPAVASFNDVPTSDPAFQFVEALAASGITAGCGGGNYCPDASLTRRQMAVFLAKALGLQWPEVPAP